MEKRWEGAKTLQGTQSIHFVKAVEPYVIEYKLYSSSETSNTFNFLSGQISAGVANQIIAVDVVNETSTHITPHITQCIASSAADAPSIGNGISRKFVLVDLPGKKISKRFVALVLKEDKDSDEVEAVFPRRCRGVNCQNIFSVPDKQDLGPILLKVGKGLVNNDISTYLANNQSAVNESS